MTTEQSAELERIFGCRKASLPFTYLGIPLSDKRLPKTSYLPLLHNLSKRLGGWAARFLSMAGRLVLVNSVLSSLPVYLMTVLKLPQWVIKEIDRIRRRFLWHGAGDQQKGYHLVNWEEICEPKSLGGLGVIDLGAFNQILLLKWYWWWYTAGHRLWKPLMSQTATIQEGRPLTTVFIAVSAKMRDFFNNSTCWTPGDGSSISMWNHDWGKGFMKHKFPNLFSFVIDTGQTLRQWRMLLQTNMTNLFRPNLSIEAEQELQQP